MDRLIDVTLPEWVWLNGGEHEKDGDPLEGRNVIMHVRSATVIEFFLEDDFVEASDSVLKYPFAYMNLAGIKERHVAVLHFSAAVDDREILFDILKKAALWYCEYMMWEDDNIKNERDFSLN